MALLVPEPVATEIDGLRRGLGARSLGRIAPHCTLVPPRNVAAERSDEVLALLRDVSGHTEPLSVELGPVATFFPSRPVCYLQVHRAAGPLARLAEALNAGPLAPPPGRAPRAFVPHVTVDGSVVEALIPAVLSSLARYRVEVTFATVTLLEQEPSGDHRWTPVAELGLGGARSVHGALEIAVHPSSTAALDRLAGPGRSVIEARRNGVVLGAAELVTSGPFCWIEALFVAPSERGAGIGRQLLRQAERLAAPRPLRVICRRPELGFYCHLGFAAIATLPGDPELAVLERLLGSYRP